MPYSVMGRIGYRHTPEALEKIRLAGIGRRHSKESIQKMKGIRHTGHYRKGTHPSSATEFKEGFTPWNKGKKTGVAPWSGKRRSLEDRIKISHGRKGKTAREKHHNWKGGVSSENSLIRSSFEYKEWRNQVFRRDGWTCVLCGYRSKGKINGRSDIEADHIELFAFNIELRFAVSNGRTLCRPCHKKETLSCLWT